MITRFLHSAVTVEDIESSVPTYEALGMKAAERFESPEPKALVVLMEDQNGTGVELWQLMDKDHPYAKVIGSHIAYETDALEEDTALLLGKGFKEAMPSGEDDTLRFAILRSPDGKVIELCEYKNPKSVA